MGHIRILDGLKAIDISNFTPKFEICPEKRDHVAYMRRVIAHFAIENIFIATDDDREGEAIGWHICQVFDLPIRAIKRAVFHEITESAVCKAIEGACPIGINMTRVDAAISRQILDILIGFRISPILWKYICSSKSTPLSAGRCQTPALRLLYDNKQGVEKATMRWTMKGSFFHERLDFVLSKEFDKRDDVVDFLEKSVLYDHQFTIDPSDKVSCRGPPKPFNTSTLLQTASNVLSMSPKETMSLCQQLYQDGHITYMRTDSQRLSSVFLSSAKKFIGDTWTPKYVNENTSHIESITGSGSASAHEAIRPTKVGSSTIVTKVPRMGALYHLIWKTTVESCMVDAKVNIATVEITSPIESAKYVNHIETLAFAGWKIVGGKTDDLKEQQNETLKWSLRNRATTGVNYNVIRSETVARNRGSSHYTEAGLIKRLEDLGIGRPSTYANIVDTIKDRGYVTLENIEGVLYETEDFVLNRDIGPSIKSVKDKKVFGQEKNKLVIQPIGELVVEFLMEHYRSLFEYEYTSCMEIRLDRIVEGNDSTLSICRDCSYMIDELENATKDCEKIAIPLDTDHVVVFEKYGAVIRTREKVDGEYVFIPINKKIFNLEKLRRGEYTLKDLQYTAGQGGHIENIQRTITPDLTIRLGKYGYYLYHKRKDMKSPQFYNLKMCKIPYLKCEDSELIEWIKGNYPNIL